MYWLKLNIIKKEDENGKERLYLQLDNDFQISAKCKECYRTENGIRSVELPMERIGVDKKREVEVVIAIPDLKYKKE